MAMCWVEIPLTVNGYSYVARYRQQTVDNVLVPLLAHLTSLRDERRGRVVAFLAAPPGAGKSTLATVLEHISRSRDDLATIQYLGLDGFHHYNAWLDTHTTVRAGEVISMRKVKGAPETFDLVSLREHIDRVAGGEKCGWPGYDRHLHNPVKDETIIDCDILLLEGNYLLLAEEGWDELSEHADYTIFLRAEEEMLRQRLVDRKAASGNSREKAEAFVDFSDMRNVRRCLENSKEADLTLQVLEDGRIKQL